MMRVLIVYPKIYVYGGAELLIVRLANYLSSKGIKNTLLTTSIIPEVELDLKGTSIIVIKSLIKNNLGLAFTLWRWVRDNSQVFDLINVHNFPAELSAFLCPKPVVWICNEPELYMHREFPLLRSRLLYILLFPIEKFTIRHFIESSVVSDRFNAERFKKIYKISPKIVNYGIDYNFFSEGESEIAKRKLGLEKDFVIIQIGMLTPYKNQLASIRTIQQLKDKIPNIKLILIGFAKKDYKLMLGKYIEMNRLKEYIIFKGHLNREDIRDFYYACDILMHPIKSQGGWLTPFEALCARKPIIVSSQMTASDIIKRENIGIVTNNYAEAVIDIYRNPTKYNEMANRGKEWVKQNLSWDIFSEKMLDLFCELSGSK